MRRRYIALVGAAVALLSCVAPDDADNALAGAQASRGVGVSNVALIADGRRAGNGDDWNSPAAAVLESEAAYVEYDLGRSVQFRAGYLQGDNNDEYLITVSDDGQAFRALWTAPAVAAQGLRERMSDALNGQGRWVRLSARGGDRIFSVAELALFSERPETWPPALEQVVVGNRPAQARTAFLYLVLAFGLTLFAAGAGSSKVRLLIALAPTLLALAFAGRALAQAWPLAAREVAFLRAATAAIALLALVRTAWRRFPTRNASSAGGLCPPELIAGGAGPFEGPALDRRLEIGALAFAAVVAFACFFNLGHPQGWHQAKGRPMFVHTADMRIYQPFVKYFEELRYDGVYLASVLAYAEDERGGSLVTLAGVEIRDLRNHRMHKVGEVGDDIRAIRARFSDARWASFKRDMAFFRDSMGPGYLGTLNDHGANAPPVWVWIARPILGYVQASEASLTMGGLVDALLLLAMAAALWACFGLVPMLASMTVFGATDLYMYGTNWAGATLRHEWLALLGFGACALKTKRWVLAGVLLGLATLLRSIPGVALVGVALPLIAWVIETWWRRGRPLAAAPVRELLREAVREHHAALRVLVAAVGAVAVGVLITGLLYSFGAWGEWLRKVALLNHGFSTNEVGLRALIVGTDGLAGELLRSRWPIYLAAQIGGVALVGFAARRRPLDEAMLLALPLMLLIFNPVNYHAHFVCLIPLLAARTGTLAAPGPMLAMCVASYWMTLDPDATRHFEALTVLMFAALGLVYADFVRSSARSADTTASGSSS